VCIFKSTYIRGSSGDKTLTGYRNNVTGEFVNTLPTVRLIRRVRPCRVRCLEKQL